MEINFLVLTIMSKLIFLIVIFLFPKNTFAVCPLCTVAVAGGLEISRWLGVDDLITSIWIGGLTVSLGLWLADFFTKKKLLKPLLREIVSLLIFYLLVVPYLFWSKAIGRPGNVFLGIDKIVFGTTVGSLVFLIGVFIDWLIRYFNRGKILFYYQKVLLPLFSLSLVSLVFYQFINK